MFGIVNTDYCHHFAEIGVYQLSKEEAEEAIIRSEQKAILTPLKLILTRWPQQAAEAVLSIFSRITPISTN
jgi:hypothetical protein